MSKLKIRSGNINIITIAKYNNWGKVNITPFPNLLIQISFILIILIPELSIAQTLQQDLSFLLSKRPKTNVYNIKRETAPAAINVNQISETKLLFLSMLRLYQVTLSTQDKSTCNFVPSCSRFSHKAIQNAGLIKGILLSSDRLQRCNGLPGVAYNYRFIPNMGKFYDPIERYITPTKLDTLKNHKP